MSLKGKTDFMPTDKSIKAKYAVVLTSWNQEIVGDLYTGLESELLSKEVNKDNIFCMKVPGAFELPLASKLLALQEYDAVIALGVIIKGDTPHFDFISHSCANGITQASLETKKPIIFGVLTTNDEQQAIQRASLLKDNKGAEFAQSAMQMIESIKI